MIRIKPIEYLDTHDRGKLVILTNMAKLDQIFQSRTSTMLNSFTSVGFFGAHFEGLHDEVDEISTVFGVDHIQTPLFSSIRNLIYYLREETHFEPNATIVIAYSAEYKKLAEWLSRLVPVDIQNPHTE